MEEIQSVFDELWQCIEYGLPISEELRKKALSHGLRVETVREAVLASIDMEDDLE